MNGHGNHVADLQLFDNTIHALRKCTEARSQVPAFPGWTGPASSTVLDEMGLLVVRRERILSTRRAPLGLLLPKG
jgi:hypothetical protein